MAGTLSRFLSRAQHAAGRSAIALALAGACSLSAASAGCAHESFDGRVYHSGRETFGVGPVPATWERMELDGAMLAYRDTASGGSIAVHAQCGRDADDVPLVALTNHLLIGFTERDVKHEETLPFDGREARHTVLHAKLDGVPVTLDAWVLKKDGCVYDVVYVVSPAHYDAGADAFSAFARGFHTAAE
jgi:hypothetical protein